MSSEQQQSAPEGIQKPSMPVNAGRRRIARAGIGAAGVLLTLESKVAMATGPACIAPSAAALSRGAISNYVEQGRCDALKPEDWVQREQWPHPKGEQFGQLFSGANAEYAQVTLSEMLSLDVHRHFIGRAFVTTFLNIRSGMLTVMDENTLFKMWDDLQANHVYMPNPSVTWVPAQVHAYLESTYFG